MYKEIINRLNNLIADLQKEDRIADLQDLQKEARAAARAAARAEAAAWAARAAARAEARAAADEVAARADRIKRALKAWEQAALKAWESDLSAEYQKDFKEFMEERKKQHPVFNSEFIKKPPFK
jgi:hypothetical protein